MKPDWKQRAERLMETPSMRTCSPLSRAYIKAVFSVMTVLPCISARAGRPAIVPWATICTSLGASEAGEKRKVSAALQRLQREGLIAHVNCLLGKGWYLTRKGAAL